jgi:hypothetical protein
MINKVLDFFGQDSGAEESLERLGMTALVQGPCLASLLLKSRDYAVLGVAVAAQTMNCQEFKTMANWP